MKLKINNSNSHGRYISGYLSFNKNLIEPNEIITDIKLIGFSPTGFKFSFKHNNNSGFYEQNFTLLESTILHEIYNDSPLWEYDMELKKNNYN